MHPAADLFAAQDSAAPMRAPLGGGDRSNRPAGGFGALRARGAEADRFCAWRGASGRRYVASIYRFDDCPDYEHVVAIAVRRDADGRRTALAAVDLGAFPLVALNGAAMRAAREQGANEVHLHLLAATPEARAAAIEDLV